MECAKNGNVTNHSLGESVEFFNHSVRYVDADGLRDVWGKRLFKSYRLVLGSFAASSLESSLPVGFQCMSSVVCLVARRKSCPFLQVKSSSQ